MIIMYARIVDNTVVEIIDHAPVGYPAEFEWVECPAGTGQRDTYNAKTKKFTAFELPAPKVTKLEENGATVEGEALNDPNLPVIKDRDPDAPKP